ncbi:MAG: hypothetical protein ABIH52_04435 [Candidatus Aenigmatarchaeota archaeon]
MRKSKKSNKRMFLFLLPVLLTVFVSGCTQGGGTGGNGVVINAFAPDFPQLHSNEKVSLQLEVQNMGDMKATNVEAELTGINPNEWGTFDENPTLGDLIAADRESGVQGATRNYYWNELRAPDLVKGTQFTYTPQARVSYDYTTIAQKPITIVDQDELRRIMQQGQTLPSKSTTYSAGPMVVEIKTGNYVKSSGSGSGQTYDIFPINIHIENAEFSSGKSIVQPQGFTSGFFPTDRTYPVDVYIEPPSGTSFVSSGYGEDCTSFVPVDLFQGRDIDITCELEVVDPPNIKQEGLITVELYYRYAVDASTSITVFGG